MERDVFFADMEHSDIDQEPKPPMIPFPPIPDQLRALALAKRIIPTRVDSDYSCLKALSNAQSSARLEMTCSARQSTLDEFFKLGTRILLGPSVIEFSV